MNIRLRLTTVIFLLLMYSYFILDVFGEISKELYSDLVFYFRYASSAYAFICPKPNGNLLVETFKSILTDAQGYIARDDTRGEIVVAIRGSLSLLDIITDIGIILTPFKSHGVSGPDSVLVHAGFLAAWNSVAGTVISGVRKQLAERPNYAIVTTGHSLGGSLSALAAVSLKKSFPLSNVTMYTFGQPRTGNSYYAAWVNELFGSHAFRVVHTIDGVPTMIPGGNDSLSYPWILRELTYRHHGIEYWQAKEPPSEATVIRCGPDGEDPSCSGAIPTGGINMAHMSYFGILAIRPFCFSAKDDVPFNDIFDQEYLSL